MSAALSCVLLALAACGTKIRDFGHVTDGGESGTDEASEAGASTSRTGSAGASGGAGGHAGASVAASGSSEADGSKVTPSGGGQTGAAEQAGAGAAGAGAAGAGAAGAHTTASAGGSTGNAGIGSSAQGGQAAGLGGDGAPLTGCKLDSVQPCSSYPYAPAIPDRTQCTNGNPCASPCKNGTQKCVAASDGTQWGPCTGAVGPQTADTCEPGDDGNCNGIANEGCTCLEGSTKSCGAALGAKGNCADGSTTCKSGVWGACSVKPAASDSCSISGNDANCNGLANDSCPCTPGDTGTCGDKLSAKGACRAGTATCNTQGTGWTCSIGPADKDTCVQGDDANCNGTVNDGCVCIDGKTDTCAKVLGAKGACAAGTSTCSGGKWGPCSIQPKNDTCDSDNDDSCDGQVHSPPTACTCINGTTKTCGDCGDGVTTCVSGGWGGSCVQPAQTTWYRDADEDGWGDPNNKISCSTQPAGYIVSSGDCCDKADNSSIKYTSAQIHPGTYDYQHQNANVCGVTFDYSCDGTIQKDYQKGVACTSSCDTTWEAFSDSDCGKSVQYCVCGSGCVLACSTLTLGCR